MRIALLVDNRNWADPTEPFKATFNGLRALGHQVEPIAPPRDERAGVMPWGREPDAAFVWGTHGYKGLIARRMRDKGKPAFIMERGFFDRFNYTQIDHKGFNHTASWAKGVEGPAPAGGLARFVAAWGQPPAAFEPRDGYCLLLLQVPADAQLAESQIRSPGPLVRAVEAALPDGVDIRVRGHPMSSWQCGTQGRARMIGGTLAEAVAGAAFCVTINSNAGNEALAWGCPLLCFGPALYLKGGVAMRATLQGLSDQLAKMCKGGRPDEAKVRNYLAHLACRQWSRKELADAWPLKQVLDAAA